METKRIVETPAATSPERPSYEELLACLKATADELELAEEDEGYDPSEELQAARALIARAGG